MFYGIYAITSSHPTHHFYLQKSILSVPPRGHFLLANYPPNYSPNYSQKFDQKLSSDPEGSFYSIFCEKIVLTGVMDLENGGDPPDFCGS
jgi:hypothetical protein